MDRPVVTPSLFYQYAACPHWIWYDRFGDQSRKGTLPELAQKLMEQGVVHELEYVKGLAFEHVAPANAQDAFGQTLALMKQGVERIYQGAIEAEIDGVLWRGRPDFLERQEGKSALGDWYYVPVDVKSSHSVHEEHKLQLALYAVVLRELQNRLPKEGAIITVTHERLAEPITKALVDKTRRRVGEIVKITQGKKPPLKLGTKCKHSPWFSECIRSAEEANDIALIYNVHQRTLEDLRAEGIKTVKEASEMDPDAMPKITHAGPERLQRIKLQAQSLLDGELKWIGKPEIPEAPIKLYFDIEGDPLLDVQYLFGFWVLGDGNEELAKIGHVHRDPGSEGYYLYFLAERPEDEAKMWKDFLAWVELLSDADYVVYHYAAYENAQLRQLSVFYETSPHLELFMSKLVDLARIVQQSVIFPLYFYSIKDLAKSKFLNYKWRHAKAGGAQSIFWYEHWLETGNRAVLQDVIDYNEDDVVATWRLHTWLKQNG